MRKTENCFFFLNNQSIGKTIKDSFFFIIFINSLVVKQMVYTKPNIL